MKDKVVDFLLRAKQATYAGKGAEIAPSRPNSHDFQFVEGDLKYIDTYLGGKKFAGEEALWKDDIPFWAMNYVGKTISEKFSGDFLKAALRAGSKEYPYRGPKEYRDGLYLYKCNVKGEFDRFYGYEEITFDGEVVYDCLFHGGAIN